MAKINLHSEITNAENAISYALDRINYASKGEELDVNMSTMGGDVMLGMPFGEEVLRHEGLTKVMLDGACNSMGAFLLTYFDERRATEGATFMFHKAYASEGEEDPMTLKILETVNTNFRKRMEERGMDAKLIEDIFDKDQEVTLTAREARTLGVIDEVVKTERENGKPFERILAQFKSITSKMSKSKLKSVTLALIKADGGQLLTMFETPDGVVTEGTQLTPLNGGELSAGDYDFEGSKITVDGDGKVTAVETKPEETPEEIEAKKKAAKAKADAEAPGVTAEAVAEMVSTAVEAAFEPIVKALNETLAGTGTNFKISATTKKNDTIIAKVPSQKVQALTAEGVIRAKVLAKGKRK